MFTINKKGLYENNEGVILPLNLSEKLILIFDDVNMGYKSFLKSGYKSLALYLADLIGEW